MPMRGAVIVLLLAFIGAKAFAQDVPSAELGGHHGQGHAQNHDWYKELKQPGTSYSCCNGAKEGVEGDCRPTRAFQADDGTWRALLNGRWVPVPPKVVLQTLAP